MSSTEVERQLRDGLWCLGASLLGHSLLSAPTIAKLQVRRTRPEKVQTGGDGVQGALEGANRVAGDSLR